MKITEFLATVEPFDTLSPGALKRLAAKVDIEQHSAGSRIITKGEPGDSMYVIVAGQAAVPVEHADGMTRFQAQLPSGHFFGEMAVLTDAPRSADVFASEPCVLVRIPRLAVLDLVAENTAVAGFLTEVLGERLMEQGGIRRVGKYELVRRIGRGGMSIVFEGRHPELDRPVAVKMLSHALIYRRNFAERFRNEGKIIASLDHRNIVQVYDMEEAYATFFIVMELLGGEDLSDIISRRRMDSRETRAILRQVASALDYAHSKGVVHRDVKPSNVNIDTQGQIRLMDFGLAKVTRLEQQLEEDEDIVLGTPYYMSPEQARGTSLDLRTDVYNLGVLAFEMLTGQRPYSGRSKSEVQRKHVEAPVPEPRSILPHIPADLNAFIVRCMQKHPADRFQTCQEVLEFLNRTGTTMELRVETIRLAYDSTATDEVEDAVTRFKEHVRRIPGVEVT